VRKKEEEKEETTAAEYNSLPYWAVIIMSEAPSNYRYRKKLLLTWQNLTATNHKT